VKYVLPDWVTSALRALRSFASLAQKVSARERETPFALSSQRTAKLAKNLISPWLERERIRSSLFFLTPRLSDCVRGVLRRAARAGSYLNITYNDNPAIAV